MTKGSKHGNAQSITVKYEDGHKATVTAASELEQSMLNVIASDIVTGRKKYGGLDMVIISTSRENSPGYSTSIIGESRLIVPAILPMIKNTALDMKVEGKGLFMAAVNSAILDAMAEDIGEKDEDEEDEDEE